MSTPRKTVLDKHTFSHEILEVFDFAEKIAREQAEEEILCVHVFVACACLQPDILQTLLGRGIVLLPKKYDIEPDAVSKASGAHAGRPAPGAKLFESVREELEFDFGFGDGAEKSPAFSDELSLIFLDDTSRSILGMFANYTIENRIGVAETLLAILTEPTEEISDILLKNGFPNDAMQLGELLRENFLRHICDFRTGTPGERLSNAVSMSKKIRESMRASLIGQDKAIRDVASFLTDFWFRGNNGKPLVLLILGKPGCGRSCFAQAMQQAFVDAGLQNRIDTPIDLSGFMHEQGCEPDLLGDAKSYRNARPGLLYNKAKNNRRGVIVFEDILEGCRAAKSVLRSFASNLAFEKYHEESILIPNNVLIFTMRISEDQYGFLRENGAKKLDAKLLCKLFRDGDQSDCHEQTAAHDTVGLWQRADQIVMLEDLSENELETLAGNRMDEIADTLKRDYGIAFRCDDRKRFISMLLLSSPDELGPGLLAEKMDDAFRDLWGILNDKPEIREVELACEALPEYRYAPDRRIIRGDYIDFTRIIRTEGNTVRMAYEGLRYVQQDRVDCGDYRIEHPKSITFEDIVGHDDVRDELIDSLNCITNRDMFHAPDACRNIILFGPPGTGKTSLIVALGNSADVPVLFVPNAVFTNPQKLRAMFRKAESVSPAIVVMEELNTLGNSLYGRRDAINEMLSLLDGPQKQSKLLFLGTTNHLDQLEPALIRPERFGRLIEVGLPDRESRLAYILKFERKYDISIPEDIRNAFAVETDGCSPAELKGMLGFALRKCIRENRPLDLEALLRSSCYFRRSSGKTIGFNRGDER
jgi:AAA+ superfamily predicted ATPase